MHARCGSGCSWPVPRPVTLRKMPPSATTACSAMACCRYRRPGMCRFGRPGCFAWRSSHAPTGVQQSSGCRRLGGAGLAWPQPLEGLDAQHFARAQAGLGFVPHEAGCQDRQQRLAGVAALREVSPLQCRVLTLGRTMRWPSQSAHGSVPAWVESPGSASWAVADVGCAVADGVPTAAGSQTKATAAAPINSCLRAMPSWPF